jgi:hypothetical protein
MNVVAEMLFSEPAPLAIWATLMLLTLPAVLVLGSPHGVRSPRRALLEVVDLVRERGERRRQRQQEAVQAVRYAEEVRAAAGRAAHAAELWQERWEQSEQERSAAWSLLVAAESRLRRSHSAAAFGTPWTPQTPTEYAARERFLHRSVRAAAARGELPTAAVADALAARAGWDPCLHPVDQELAVHRAAVAHLKDRYTRAAAAEQTAWHDAQLAARTRDSLRAEATAAEVAATPLRPLLPATAPAPVRAAARRTAMNPA